MQLLRRRPVLISALVVVAVATVVVLVWFQPQKLFIDDRADEAIPMVDTTASAPPAGGATAPASPVADVQDLAVGSFISRDHSTSGSVRIIELADGQRFVRIEDLSTDNGPDLFVYLSRTPADGDERSFDDEFVNLGRLKGNLGNQNYELPGDVVVEEWTSVVIWCDRFSSAFGAADLAAA